MATIHIPLADRLEHGVISVDEMLGLALIGRTSFYDDVKLGLCEVEKHGRFTRIQGTKAKEYLARLSERGKENAAELAKQAAQKAATASKAARMASAS